MTLSTKLRTVFESNKDEYRRRVGTLEQAVAAILAGSLGEELRAAAEREAHMLAGSLGTFGLARGSELARELELSLAPGQGSVQTDMAHLAECVEGLRRELDDQPAGVDANDERIDGVPALVDLGVVERAHDDPANARELRRARFETGLTATEPMALTAGRILVVDDDESVRQALVCILSDAGYDVRDVGSAREARYALEHDTIALLLSDVSMPGETGLELIRFALCEHPETATLLISALEDPGIAQVAMDFGAYGYLSKPVRPSALLIGVINALRRRDMEANERAARENLEHTVRLRTSALSQALERLEDAAKEGRELHAETIHRWARASEYGDPGIDRHLKRVSRYCGVLGRELGLDDQSLELASVLHDVGNVALPDSVLLKPEPLTADERLALESHAEIGYEMLRDSSSSLLDLAASIARTHHERFDGGGYPRGLSGTDIPLEGRIAAVADVFDALSCDRVSRPAWSVKSSISWMRRERGRHFDPGVLDALLSSMDEVLAIRSALING